VKLIDRQSISRADPPHGASVIKSLPGGHITCVCLRVCHYFLVALNDIFSVLRWPFDECVFSSHIKACTRTQIYIRGTSARGARCEIVNGLVHLGHVFFILDF
jgi:hypothetical protein